MGTSTDWSVVAKLLGYSFINVGGDSIWVKSCWNWSISYGKVYHHLHYILPILHSAGNVVVKYVILNVSSGWPSSPRKSILLSTVPKLVKRTHWLQLPSSHTGRNLETPASMPLNKTWESENLKLCSLANPSSQLVKVFSLNQKLICGWSIPYIGTMTTSLELVVSHP